MASLRVEVVYALAGETDAVTVRLPSGATVADALRASGLIEKHRGIADARIGIYGKVVAADTPLADGDRVEIYRPLALDPKEARRRRAVKKL
jgi:putative ubiquitin-RnfH superfamily antitoxin RatB of RatAB toxin-antitoxin module